MVHPGGRPRSIVPEYDELVELGKDLLKWAKIDKDDDIGLHLRWSEWYTSKGYITHQWDKMLEKPEFRVYYESAQQYLAKRWLTNMNPSIAHRFIRHYCPEVKKEENEEAEHKASLQKQAEMNPDDFRKQLLSVVSDGQAIPRAIESGKSDLASQ